MNDKIEKGVDPYQKDITKKRRLQPCPICETPMGDMPGSRDAYCKNCGYKDPCCE